MEEQTNVDVSDSSEQLIASEGSAIEPASENPTPKEANKTWADRLSFYLLVVLVFLLPLVFMPSLSLPFAKISFAVLVISVLFVLACISVLKRGAFSLPRNSFLIAAFAVPVIFIFASLFSGSINNSFFGSSFEIGTAVTIIVGIVTMILVSRILRTKEQIFLVYVAFFSSFLLVALFQIIRLIAGPSVLSFGLFTTATSNLIGTWSENGIFFGLVAIMSVITLQTLKLSKAARIINIVVLIISLTFVFLVNYASVYIVIAAFALISCLYFYWLKKKVAVPSLIVLILTVVFILFAFTSFGNNLRAHLPASIASINPTNVEEFPSFTETLSIAGHAIKADPFFGVGPNRFQNEWLLYRPANVNLTQSWDVDFTTGFGFMPTSIVDGGILGALAWLAFLVLFLWLGWKALLREPRALPNRYLSLSSFLAALYLWLFSILYVPSGVIYIMTFVFTGIFIASLCEEGKVGVLQIPYAKNRRIGFISVFAIIVALIATISLFVITVEKVIAARYVDAAAIAANVQNDYSSAHTDIQKALLYDRQPSYYQTQAQFDMAEIGVLFSDQNPQVATSTLQSEFQADWDDALANANAAIAADPKNYQSYLLLGNMYEEVFQLGFTTVYPLANAAYQNAATLDPTNPDIFLSLAQLEVTNKDATSTSGYISKALEIKPNYTNALYDAAQFQASVGDVNGAIQSMADIIQLTPTDPTAFYELGYLEYAAKNYTVAIQALTKAITLENDYSNARYFLGLSYYQIGQNSNAIAQFVAVQKLNPGNQSVASILANLRAGIAPLPNENAASDQKASTQQLKNQPSKSSSSATATSASVRQNTSASASSPTATQ